MRVLFGRVSASFGGFGKAEIRCEGLLKWFKSIAIAFSAGRGLALGHSICITNQDDRVPDAHGAPRTHKVILITIIYCQPSYSK